LPAACCGMMGTSMEAIGKYTIVRQIGFGGFGVVYEGVDPFLKRRVAIKTCTTDEEEIRDRFFREAEIAGNLQHRHIVTVHDFGIQDGVPYLVQEYLSGEDLARVIARREPLSPERKLEILLEVARGLEHAHSRGVIHRDVKPANIRITEGGTVKIMDFGIAKLANVASHLTRTGMTLGTAAYLPPEQIKGQAVDHRADLFSFGVLSYELLAYSRPFAGRTLSVLFFEILNQEPAPISDHFPECPRSIEAMVLRCLAKDPERRYLGLGPVIESLVRGLVELRSPPVTTRSPSASSEVPMTDRATRKVSADIVREAMARAKQEHGTRGAQEGAPHSIPSPPGAAGSPPPQPPEAPPKPSRPRPTLSWGPPEMSPPEEQGSAGIPPHPPQPPTPSAGEIAGPQPSGGSDRGAAVPYPSAPRLPSSIPWPLLGALGGALVIFLLVLLFVVLF
jgi:serine/threonine protein kinase